MTNQKDVVLFVDKAKGCYHHTFNDHNFLNAEMATDLPGRFSSFFIDLTAVKTETHLERHEARIIKIVEDPLNEKPGAKGVLEKARHPSSNIQFKGGL